MGWMSRAVVVSAVLTPTLTAAALAQRRADLSTAPAVRREAIPVKRIAQQPATSTMGGPQWSLFAGVASGDGAFDIGLAAGGGGRWRSADWPVGVRGDIYYAHHSGDIGSQFGGYDVSVDMFGVTASAEYPFPTENKLKPYVFGGLGVFYSNRSAENDALFEDTDYDSSTDLGLAIGGGIRLTERFGLELRFMDIGEFSTLPILAAWHF